MATQGTGASLGPHDGGFPIAATDREGEIHQLYAQPGSTLMEVLRDAELDVEAVCGGGCACATCHVHIAPEWTERVGSPGEIEAALLDMSPHFDAQHSRLSCQIPVTEAIENLSVTVAPED